MLFRGQARFYTLYLRYFYRFDYMGRRVCIDPSCDICARAARYIYLGENVSIDKSVWLNIPCEAPSPVRGRPILRLGDGTAVGRGCFFSGINQIHIGNDVLFGPRVFMTDHSHCFDNPSVPILQQGVTEPGSIIVEDGCWFGYNSAVLTQKGRRICIGKNSVIGTNAVVTKSFPANSVLVGVPAVNLRANSPI